MQNRNKPYVAPEGYVITQRPEGLFPEKPFEKELNKLEKTILPPKRPTTFSDKTFDKILLFEKEDKSISVFQNLGGRISYVEDFKNLEEFISEESLHNHFFDFKEYTKEEKLKPFVKEIFPDVINVYIYDEY